MTRLALLRGAPTTIRVDNGPEFISKALDRWAYQERGHAELLAPRKANRQRIR
jgi:putative transposase